MIFFQDIRERAVYWIWFPLLTGTLLFLRLHETFGPHPWWKVIVLNLAMISVQLLLLTAYFSVKNRRLTNLTRGLLGWGDLLLLFGIAVYFSTLNFMFYYLLSLAFTLLVWSALMILKVVKSKKIPLAGFQAAMLALFLAAEWWFNIFNLGDDTWLINLISK